MSSVAFDTLKLAQRLEAAGFPPKQAQDMASAISDTIIDTVVTREYLDLRFGEIRVELAALKAEILKWMFGAVGLQTLAILDALNAADLPVIEVHLSNIFRRERFRHHSYVSLAARGVICGLGPQGYELALEALASVIEVESSEAPR